MKKKTTYLVVYSAVDKNNSARSCRGNIEIKRNTHFVDPEEVNETIAIINDSIGHKWKVIIDNIIKFPIK